MMTVKEAIVEVVPILPPAPGEALTQCSSHEVHADHSVSWQSWGQAFTQFSSKSGGFKPWQRQSETMRPTTWSGSLNITQMASRLFTPNPQLELGLSTTQELQRPARQWKVSHSLEAGQGRTSDKLPSEENVDSIPKANKLRLRKEVLRMRPLLHDGGQADQADHGDTMFSIGHWMWQSSSYGGWLSLEQASTGAGFWNW